MAKRGTVRSASVRPTTDKTKMQQTALSQKGLDPEVKKMLDMKKADKALMDSISKIAPPEDQLAVARIFCKGRIKKAFFAAALSPHGSEGYRRRFIALCREAAKGIPED